MKIKLTSFEQYWVVQTTLSSVLRVLSVTVVTVTVVVSIVVSIVNSNDTLSTTLIEIDQY